jgi:hypothetical protein
MRFLLMPGGAVMTHRSPVSPSPAFMQRKQLLGIRRRAESTSEDTLVPADRAPTADKDAA